MKFELELEELRAVVAILGEIPTKHGFYPIMKKLEAQLPPPSPPQSNAS